MNLSQDTYISLPAYDYVPGEQGRFLLYVGKKCSYYCLVLNPLALIY